VFHTIIITPFQKLCLSQLISYQKNGVFSSWFDIHNKGAELQVFLVVPESISHQTVIPLKWITAVTTSLYFLDGAQSSY